MGDELRRFLAALGYLTRLPLPAGRGPQDAWPPGSVRHFPGVGLCVGAWGALVLWAAAHVWPALLAVLVSMAATAWWTRALHERGLGAGTDALTLLFVLALKAAALQGLAVRDLDAVLMLLPLAHAWSRSAGVLVLRLLPAGSLQQGDDAVPRVDGLTWVVALMWAGVAAAAAALFIAGTWLLLAALSALACTALLGRWLQQRTGSHPAVVLGVVQQGCEVAVYMAVLAAMARG